MWRASDMAIWQGRIDAEEGGLGLRWHQCVRPHVPGAAGDAALVPAVLIGFCCDAGVARNHGRVGAVEGPAVLRRALSNLAWHQTAAVYDGGDVVCEGDELEAAQATLGHAVAVAHASGARPIVIGGGHEVAWGSWQGTVAEAERRGTRKIGVINFDAHFDLRAGAQGNSGTSFRKIADDCGARGIPFNYLCVGVAKSANTAALFERAQTLGARWVFDDELTPWNIAQAQWVVADFMERVDVVHLSLDLDVLPAAVAPGVSAPAARGVNLAVLELLLDQVLASGKVLVAEMAELNPRFDIDHRTARVAARLVDRICGVDWRIQRAAG